MKKLNKSKEKREFTMDYAVVMSTLNRGKLIGKAIDSVFKQSIKPKEFIIVMDAKSDIKNIDLLLQYKKKYPILKIYYTKSNLGAMECMNLGVNMANTDYILIIDDDVELMNEDWIKLAFKKLKKKHIALVWGTVNQGNYPKFRYGNFIAVAFLFKKWIFQKVKGFPKEFILYNNEIDLTIRLHMEGYYPLFYEKLDVKHYVIPSKNKSLLLNKEKKYIYYDLSNRLFVYWKYYPSYIAIFLSIFHILKILRFNVKKFEHLKSLFKGIKRFISEYYKVVDKNRRVLPLKRLFQICYQQQFPALLYNFLKKVYGK